MWCIALAPLAALAADPADAPTPPTAEQRAFLVGMPELANRLEGLSWDRDAEHLEASRLADGTIDLLYTYEPKDRDGQVDYLHHNVLINYYRPNKPHDKDDLELGVKAFTNTLGYVRTPIEPAPLGWGEVNLCYLIHRRNAAPSGTLCVAAKDRYTVIYAIDGLLLKEPGAMDALLGDTLQKLLRFQP